MGVGEGGEVSEAGAPKTVRRSVAVVVPHPDDPDRILTVRRPPDDEDLPDVWGLPAASLEPGESWEEAVHRTGRDKLGVRLRAVRLLRMGETSRPRALLHMRLYRAEIAEGEPRVPQPVAGVTQYVETEWASPGRLAPAARRGSLCSRLCLEVLGRPWRSAGERQGTARPGTPG